MESQIQYRGISRAASDMAVTDGGVTESANIIIDNGEIAPIIAPKVISSLPTLMSYDLLYLHKTSAFSNYIALASGAVCWIADDIQQRILVLDNAESVVDVKAVNNTLVILTSTRMHYSLFKNNSYTALGSELPFPNLLIFPLYATEAVNTYNHTGLSYGTTTITYTNTINAKLLDNYPQDVYEPYIMASKSFSYDERDLQDDVNDGMNIRALTLSKAIWDEFNVTAKRRYATCDFSTPIFVRYALRLYDGTHTKQSAPILLAADKLQTLISNCNLIFWNGESSSIIETINKLYCTVNTCKYKIVVGQASNMSQLRLWSDIITGIDIYLSQPVYLQQYDCRLASSGQNTTGDTTFQTIPLTLNATSGEKQEEEVLNRSIFYKVKQLDIEDLASSVTLNNISEALGDNLVLQPILDDDYRSHHQLIPKVMFTMNGRLNIANIKSKYYSGFANPASLFTPTFEILSLTHSVRYTLKFYIKGEENGEVVTMTTHLFGDYGAGEATDSNGNRVGYFGRRLGPWIVYPDTRCYQVDVYTEDLTSAVVNSIKKATFKMKEHPNLNCSYYWAGVSPNYDITTVATINSTVSVEDMAGNRLLQSEVNNPFVFPLSGRHTLSGGEILGVNSVTKAISQGQFGQFPLYVFCVDGIWAMSTNASGEYSSISPLSREVCTNAKSITGIDGSIVFVSSKGVMMLQGGDIECISENMVGKHHRADSFDGLEQAQVSTYGGNLIEQISDSLSFADYIKQAYIAYDYPNKRLIVLNSACSYQYIYSLKSGTWHKIAFGLTLKRSLNSYPDCYLQCENGDADATYNFSVIDDVNDINTRTLGVIISRAFDLGQPGVLKTIMQIKHRGNYNKEYLRYILYGSRDHINYVPISSLKGSSFKSYKIAILLKLLPTERLNSTIFAFEPKFTNKVR